MPWKNNLKFVFLFCCALLAGPARADTGYDVVRQRDIGCGGNNYWGTGSRIFCEYPDTQRCKNARLASNSVFQGCEPTPCSGYPTAKFNPDKMEPEPKNTLDSQAYQSCWAWKCRLGFLEVGTDCLSPAECRAMPGHDVSADGKSCETSKWCDENLKLAYNSLVHEQYMDGACAKMKCRDGGCFESVTSFNCLPSNEDGTFGGTHPAGSGVCAECAKNQYVKGAGCETGAIATMAIMRNCFDCLDPDEFEKCVRGGGVPTPNCNKAPQKWQIN